MMFFAVVAVTALARTQTIQPRGIVAAGGHGGDSITVSWSVGQAVSRTFTGDQLITSGIQQPDRVYVQLDLKVLLGGPYVAATGLMSDGLRAQGWIPVLEPSSGLGFVHKGDGGGETTTAGVLAVQGNDAIVDWVFVELRSATSPQVVLSTCAALVQRDGDLVDVNGILPIKLSAVPGQYMVAIKHRNHLPVLTQMPVALGTTPLEMDLTDGSVATYGTDAQRIDGGVRLLWPGDADGNGSVRYSGSGNDRTIVLNILGASTFLSPVPGYRRQDLNLNGVVSYSGSGNDRTVILNTLGAATFLSPRAAQLP